MAERELIVRIGVEGVETSRQKVEQFTGSSEELQKILLQQDKSIEELTGQLKEYKKALNNSGKANKSAKQELKGLREQLITLERQGKRNTEEYIKLEEQAGKLEDAIGDVNDRIKQSGSDTRGLDKVIRVASTATAAFGLVEGAAALFGKENEELQKSLLRVNAAMTVLTSLQQIQAEVSKTDSIFTSAAAKAKAAYAAATAGATTALGVFRLALIATGIGGAVVAIGFLVANWDKLTRAIKGNKAALDDIKGANEQLEKSLEFQNKELELKILRLQAQGVEEEKILQFQKQELANQLLLAAANLKKAKSTLEEALAQRVARIEAERRLSVDRKNILIKQAAADIEKEFGKEVQDSRDIFQSVEKAYLSNQIAIDELNKKKKESTKETEKEAKGLDLLEEKISKLQNKIRELDPTKNGLIIRALFGEKLELEKKVKEITDGIDKIRREVAGTPLQPVGEVFKLPPLKEVIKPFEQSNKSIQQLNELFNKSFVEANKNRVKKINFENRKEFEQVAEGLQQNGFLRAGAIRSEIERRKKANEDLGTLEKDLQLANIQGAANAANQAFAFFKQIQDARLAILKNRLDQGLISEEEYNKKVAEINRRAAIADKAKALFDIGIATAVAIVNALKIAPPAGTILAGIVGGLAALQAAVVAATPIPKFRKGGEVLAGGNITPEGMLSGRSHSKGGILIEAEGGEFITRRDMAAKYMPLLKAINADKVDAIMKPQGIALTRTYKPFKPTSERQAERRMNKLIEEVRFLSQYVRQGNKWQRVTAENTGNLKTSNKYHRV